MPSTPTDPTPTNDDLGPALNIAALLDGDAILPAPATPPTTTAATDVAPGTDATSATSAKPTVTSTGSADIHVDTAAGTTTFTATTLTEAAAAARRAAPHLANTAQARRIRRGLRRLQYQVIIQGLVTNPAPATWSEPETAATAPPAPKPEANPQDRPTIQAALHALHRVSITEESTDPAPVQPEAPAPNTPSAEEPSPSPATTATPEELLSTLTQLLAEKTDAEFGARLLTALASAASNPSATPSLTPTTDDSARRRRWFRRREGKGTATSPQPPTLVAPTTSSQPAMSTPEAPSTGSSPSQETAPTLTSPEEGELFPGTSSATPETEAGDPKPDDEQNEHAPDTDGTRTESTTEPAPDPVPMTGRRRRRQAQQARRRGNRTVKPTS